MSCRLRLVVEADRGRADVAVDLCDATVTVGELAAALGLDAAGGGLHADGRFWPAHVAVDATAIADGSLVSPVGPDRLPVPAGCDVLQVDGLDAGRWWRLPLGPGRVGAAREVLHLDVACGGALVMPGGAHDLSLESASVHEPVEAGEGWITAGGRRYRVTPRSSAATRAGERAGGGTAVFRRPPRHRVGTGPVRVTVSDAPPEPLPAQPLSWVAILAPLPVGIFMAVLMDPRFLVFSLMSPVMVLGRWAEGRYRRRRATRRHAAEAARWRAELEVALVDDARRETARRRRAAPDLATLARAAETGHHTLWERRLDHDDALALVAGIARPLHRPDVDRARLDGSLDLGRALDAVPVTVDLRDATCIGVAGDRGAALAVARSLLVQAIVLHGPADVSIAVLTVADRVHEWGWTKWLPHRAGTERPGVAVEPADAADLIPPDRPRGRGPGALRSTVGTGTDRRGGPVTLLVVDDDGRHLAGRSAAVREALAEPDRDVRAIVVADGVTDLPAVCSTALEVDGRGRLVIHHVGTGAAAEVATAVGTTGEVADRVARSLARWCDPETATGATSIPDHVPLAPLLDAETGDAAEAVLARWRRADRRSLVCPLGASASGPLDADLVGDGPHALVAGTTGSGKSELLRSWVVGLAASADVDHVNFVLIDFKGGGAFDRCADLPHAVASITDLDEHLAARALRCLHAEVRHREVRLRQAGVSDIADLPDGAPGGPLPRLVVVVDEFATLAAELPEFLRSLVDVARRGRSLGIHLILATQRPHGVLDNEIRANTNLRIALRVQDDMDSMDVIDAADAASISRRRPGQGFVRLGAGELVAFRSALVTTATPDPAAGPRISVAPFELLDLPGGPDVGPPSEPADAGSDLARLVAGVRAAHHRSGCAAPRVPWPEPLPSHLDAAELAGDTSPAPWTTPLGLVDLPDQQRQDVWSFDATGGSLLVYGVHGPDTTQVLATVALGLAAGHPADRFHLYVVDLDTNALAPLAGMPQCGAYITADDTERLERLLDLLDGELDRRRALVAEHRLRGIDGSTRLAGRPVPLVALLLANHGALLDHCEEARDLATPQRLQRILRDGPSLGVVVVASSAHPRAVPLRVANQVPCKLLLKLADDTAYATFGIAPRDVPALPPGRAVDPETRREIQLGVFAGGDIAAAAAAVPTHPRCRGRGPVPVRSLPVVVGWADIDHDGFVDPTGLALPVGLAARELTTASLRLRPGEHAIVSGPPSSGKSSVLIGLATAARGLCGDGPRSARVVAVAPEWSPLAAAAVDECVLPADVATRLATVDGPTVLLVDDADQLPPDAGPAIKALVEARHRGVHVVAAARPEELRGFQSWTQVLRSSRTGLALRPAPADAELFRTIFTLRPGEGLPDGRGFLVTAGESSVVQFAAPAIGTEPAAGRTAGRPGHNQSVDERPPRPQPSGDRDQPRRQPSVPPVAPP